VIDARGDEVDPEQIARMSFEQLNDLAWRNGSCSHLMHSSQRAAYAKLRAWQKVQPRNQNPERTDTFRNAFLLPVSKRWGKSSMCLWVKTEDALRAPGSKHRYTAAHDNAIHSIIADIQREVFRYAPDDIRPTYHGKKGARGAGFYFPEYGPAQGSVIFLAGLESNPDALRGQECDGGDVVGECAFIPNLLYVVRNVLIQQYQGKPNAYMIMESSAPKDIDTDWERIFLVDAQERDAIFDATLEDNPMLSREDKDKFLELAGGRGNPDCEREYFNVIAVPTEERLVPEWQPHRHVQLLPTPEYAHCYVSTDPGSADLFGILWAWWDYSRGLLYFRKDWAKRNANTDEVAAVIKAVEAELWASKVPDGNVEPVVHRGGRVDGLSRYEMMQLRGYDTAVPKPEGALLYYDDNERILKPNPYMRVTDVDRSMARDMGPIYGLDFHPANKADSAEARKNAFRDAVKRGQVLAHPDCVLLNSHLNGGRWNKHRTDWARTAAHGHFDLLAAAIQMWRVVAENVNLNPNPPFRPQVAPGQEVMESLPWQQKATREREAMEVMNGLLVTGAGELRVRVR
jgi:hypothetical protein